MSEFEYLSPVEAAIRQAMADGLFDNLPGAGKPLNLDDDSAVPEDMRMAYKIMKDNNIQPEWITQRQALEHQCGHILHELARGYRAYCGTLQDAERRGDVGLRQRAERAWERLLQTFDEAVSSYNRQVLVYNLKIPPGVAQRNKLNLARELERLTAGSD